MKAIYSRQVTVVMLPLLLLIAGALLFTGCESDPVAPHDEIPALTKEDAAYQALYLGKIFNEVGVQIVSFQQGSIAEKQLYTYTFPTSSSISGMISLEYFMGGIDGTPATYSEGDFAHLYTTPDGPLVLSLGLGGSASFAFDLMADIERATNTATILTGSAGTFASGDYSATFSFEDVVVTAGQDYPSSGSISFTTEGFQMKLTYDGDNTAELEVGGVLTYIVNLDDDSLTGV